MVGANLTGSADVATNQALWGTGDPVPWGTPTAARLNWFEFSTAIGVAYVPGRAIADLGFGYGWAGPMLGRW
jgi:hypothetical protein